MMRKYSLHFMIRKLEMVLADNPSADWCKDWIDAYAYYCGCIDCMERLRKDNIDLKMLQDIFKW